MTPAMALGYYYCYLPELVLTTDTENDGAEKVRKGGQEEANPNLIIATCRFFSCLRSLYSPCGEPASMSGWPDSVSISEPFFGEFWAGFSDDMLSG
jgi:hypothetical protein